MSSKTKKLLLVRGLPGSGKSTFARQIEQDYDFIHLETDMYFMDKMGDYNYDKTKIQEAHNWCLRQTESMILDQQDVVVSNTFTTFKEIEPYVNLSKKYRYNFAVICCKNEFKSIHDIPEIVIEKMTSRFEAIPGEIIKRVDNCVV